MSNDKSIGNDKTMMPGDDARKASLNPGDTLGQYKIIRLLGRGGMGEVYEVEHSVLRKRYALKLLPTEVSNRSDSLTRFKQEAEVMANLDHPNILSVDDFGESDARYWLRMELANGGRCQTSAPTGRPHRSPGLSDSATLGGDQGKDCALKGHLNLTNNMPWVGGLDYAGRFQRIL